jgi:DsbC/DsbD-like thiol-disulfide interchange protein
MGMGFALIMAGLGLALPGCSRHESNTAGLSQSVVPAAPLSSAQQTPEEQVVEVKPLLSRDGVRPGETFKAAIILKVQAGYHINDNAPRDEFMFPTSLTIEENPAVEVLEIYYPTGHRGRFAYSQTELVVYEGEATLGVLLKAKAGISPGAVKLSVSLSYQACDNTSCLPPKELGFEIPVPFVGPGSPCHDLQPEIFSKIPFKTPVK